MRSSILNRAALLIGAGLAALLPVPYTAAAQDAEVSAPANVLDWSGTWATDPDSSIEGIADCCSGDGKHVPLTPKYRTLRDDYVAMQAANGPIAINNSQYCLPAGMPGVLLHPILFEFLFTPGRVTMIFDDGEVRRIWTDGRDHPAKDDLILSYAGHSIGHWEGDTLVVDTVGIAPTSDLFLSGPLKVTQNTHIVERMRLGDDGVLLISLTVEDPLIFSTPFTMNKRYQKVPGTFEVGCAANNRDLDDSIDLDPPF